MRKREHRLRTELCSVSTGGRLPSRDAPGHREQLPTLLHTRCPSPGRTAGLPGRSQSPVRRPAKSSHISGAHRSRPFPNMDPAWCPNPLPEPAIRSIVWGTPRGVYGKTGRAPWSTGGNGSVPSLCSSSLARDPPRPMWGRGKAPGVKGNEDKQARTGMGEFRAAEPFLTEAWFPAGPLWKRHRT